MTAPVGDIMPPAPNLAGLSDAFVWDCLDAESEGDGILFARLFGDAVRYCVDQAKWYIWTGTVWREDKRQIVFALVSAVVDCYGELKNSLDFAGDDEAKKGAAAKRARIDRRIKHLRKPAGRNACLEFAWKGRGIAVEAAAFDADPHLLGVQNGTLDLRTGMLRKARPEDMITKQAGCAYREWHTIPGAQQSVVTDFFCDIWGDDAEKIAFAKRLFGQALIGKVVDHVFPFFIGRRSRNGKGVLVSLLLHVWGDYGIIFKPEMLYATKGMAANAVDPDIMNFEGARLAISDEVTDGVAFSAEKVKRMTGGNHLKGRNPFELNRTFKPSHTLIMVGNHEPIAPAGDPGFWERVMLIDFPFHFSYTPDPDPAKKERLRVPNYEEKLINAAEAFLAYFVDGAILYQAEGRLNAPESVRKDTTEYRDESDWLMLFVRACTQESDADTKSSDLYNAFVVFYRENINEKFVPSQHKFGKKMRETGIWPAARKADGVYFKGIELDPVWARRLDEDGGWP